MDAKLTQDDNEAKKKWDDLRNWEAKWERDSREDGQVEGRVKFGGFAEITGPIKTPSQISKQPPAFLPSFPCPVLDIPRHLSCLPKVTPTNLANFLPHILTLAMQLL